MEQQAKTRNKKEPLTPDHGRVPPQATDLEYLVLGACMVEKDAIELIDLVPDDFYKVSNQKIFSAILKLKNSHNPIDMFTVTEELKRSGELEEVGGPYAISVMTAGVNSAAHIDYHAAIIKQKSISRKFIHFGSELQKLAFNDETDVSDIQEFAERYISEMSVNAITSDYYTMEQSIKSTTDYLVERQIKQEKGEQPGIPTGLKDLDKATNGGWSAPDLIVIGGRPSMGKTQFAISFAKAAGLHGDDVLFLSLEMTRIQLVMRMLNEVDGVSHYNMKNGKLSREEWDLINKKINELLRMNIMIADSVSIRYIQNIKSMARRLHRQGKLKLLIIDYLGYIKTNMKFGLRQQEVGHITSELKALGKELNIPIILLAQLNRPAKGLATVPKPDLTDLREAGDIEQDADIVIFPHRPDYYDKDITEESGRSWHNRGVLYIGKNREGVKNEKVYFQHDDRFKKIFDDEIQLNDETPF